MFSDSFTCFPNVAQLIFSSDSFGYVACFLVLATFSMRRMVPLRIVAIFSNIAFFEYGFSLGLKPVALLHGLLLPINICRLAQAYDVNIPETISKLFRSVVAVRSPVVHVARVSAISALLITGANSSTMSIFHWRRRSSTGKSGIQAARQPSPVPSCSVPHLNAR
jgi:hypothetical protein